MTRHEESQDVDSDEDGPSVLDSPSNATGVHSTPQIAGSTVKSTRVRSPPPTNGSSRRLAYRNQKEPSTPQSQAFANAADSSPFDPPSAYQPPTAQRQHADPLLHRVLDKNYRVQATPHTARKAQGRASKEQPTPVTTAQRPAALDSSPLDSSPAAPPPQLRSDLFSPAPPSAAKSRAKTAPRTPGISVQHTPGQKRTSTGRDVFTSNHQPSRSNPATKSAQTPALWDSDSDDEADSFAGMSPPKTIQFAIPQSRLLQTPAREASRKIVEDLLLTAGAEATDEIEGIDGGGPEEPSPSVVRRAWEDDDTF